MLFGREVNKAFYEDVVVGCALIRDIEVLVDGGGREGQEPKWRTKA